MTIAAFLANPTPTTWESCAHVKIAPRQTLWQAVRRLDPSFPRSKSLGPEPQEHGWSRVPDVEVVRRAVKCS